MVGSLTSPGVDSRGFWRCVEYRSWRRRCPQSRRAGMTSRDRQSSAPWQARPPFVSRARRQLQLSLRQQLHSFSVPSIARKGKPRRASYFLFLRASHAVVLSPLHPLRSSCEVTSVPTSPYVDALAAFTCCCNLSAPPLSSASAYDLRSSDF